MANTSLDGLGLQEVGGRIDLRYLPFPAKTCTWTGVRLSGVDLSGAMLAILRIVDSTLEECVFDGADCQFWHPSGSTFVDCSFARADLRRSTLGEWSAGRGNVYRRVSFVSSRWKGSTTSAAVYEDCDFSLAELERINFWQSSLIGCTFAGPVREVVFDGRMLGQAKPTSNPMERVDLTDAVLDGCDFRGVRFNSVLLPTDPDVILISSAGVLDRAIDGLAKVQGYPQAELAEISLDHLRQVLDMGADALLNLRDSGPAGELVARLIAPEPEVG